MKNSKKGIIITLLSILIIIAILIGIMIYIYLCTDYLKTNKQLFFKYTSQLVENEDGFIEQEIIDFFNKRTNSNYENQANLSFDIQVPDLQEEMQLVNKFSIDYDGKTDNVNSKKEEQVTLNYSEDVKLPFIYRECNNEVGFQTDIVSKNFVVLEDKEELAEIYLYLATLNVNINDLLENQDIESIDFNKINEFANKYLINKLQNLDESNFTKLETNGRIGYKLTLSSGEFRDLIISILEGLKELEQEKAEELITEYEQDYDNEKNIEYDIEFIVYQKDKKLSSIEVIVNNSNIVLEKQENNDEITYSIKGNIDESINIDYIASFKGLQTNNITENYKFCTEMGDLLDDGTITSVEESSNLSKNAEEDDTQENEEFMKLNYIYSNNLQFVDNVQIEDFTDKNSVNLTQKDEEYVKNLKKAIDERIEQVNEKQMEELGVKPEQNPMLYLTIDSISTKLMLNSWQESMVEEFNQKFELYENTNTRGSTVKGLLTTIINSNVSSPGNMQITEINFDGEEYEVTEQNITLLKSNIDIADTYRVEFEKDSDTGLIYRAVINKR